MEVDFSNELHRGHMPRYCCPRGACLTERYHECLEQFVDGEKRDQNEIQQANAAEQENEANEYGDAQQKGVLAADWDWEKEHCPGDGGTGLPCDDVGVLVTERSQGAAAAEDWVRAQHQGDEGTTLRQLRGDVETMH